MKTTQPIITELTQLFARFIQQEQQNTRELPTVETDENWPSPCEVGQAKQEGYSYWRPCEIKENVDFDNLTSALAMPIHPDIAAYYCGFYSENLPAHTEDGELELLFAWNREDFDRLQQNLIGHILMKKRLKQPITLFFAVTDQDDFIITLNNDNGEVWVEQVGCLPHKKLADSLSDFLRDIKFD